MIVGEGLIGLDNLSEVCLHQLRHHVNLIIILGIFWQQNPLDVQYVLVLQESLDLQFSVCPQREHSVFKGFDDLLDCYQVCLALLLVDFKVLGGDDNSVGSRVDGVDDLVALLDLEFGAQDDVGVRVLVGIVFFLDDLLLFRLLVLTWIHRLTLIIIYK